MDFTLGRGWPPPEPAHPGERTVHLFERLVNASRKRGRRARNLLRRTTSCIFTHVDFLLLSANWRLAACEPGESSKKSGFIQNPVCVFWFLERQALDRCQLVCKLWHRTIEEHHSDLALRMLDYFWLNTEQRKGQKTIDHPSFRRYRYLTVECSLREIIHFAAKSRQFVSTDKLDDRVVRLCRWGALRLLRNAYVNELKLDGDMFFFSPLTAIKAALGRRSSLSLGTLILEKLPSRTPGICWFLRDCQALFNYDTLRFDDGLVWRPRNYSRLASAVTCSAMTFYCPVVSVTYLAELLKRAKCSSLKIVDSRIKVNVIDLIQAIRSLRPSQIPHEFCLATSGNFDFDSGELDPSFSLLNMKVSSVSLTPVKADEDVGGEYMHYRYRFPSDVEGLVLEATVGLRIKLQSNGLPDVFVRKFQYRFIRGVSNVQPRANPGHFTPRRLPTELLIDILASLSRKDVDSCLLVSTALNGRIMALSNVLPLHPLEYFRMDIIQVRTSEMPSYSLAFTYHFADSSVRDLRIFDRLEKTDDPRSTAKILLAFAHFRYTYIREAFFNAPTTKFFRRYFSDDFNAIIGTVHLTRRDHCEIALRFNCLNVTVGNATIVLALIERFKQMEDTSMVPSSFTLHAAEVFGVSDVFKPPIDDIQITVEPASASGEPSSSRTTYTRYRRRIRNIRTGDQLEVCLIRPSNRCGAKTITCSLVRNPPPM